MLPGTMEECAAVDEALGVTMCKNLFLLQSAKNNLFPVIDTGRQKIHDERSFEAAWHLKTFFCRAGIYGKISEYTPGSVSVLGLMNDKDWYVDLLIDKDLMDDEYIGCHPCINTSSLKIKMDDIIKKFLKYTGHRPRYVKL